MIDYEKKKQMILGNYAIKSGYSVEILTEDVFESEYGVENTNEMTLDTLRNAYDRDLMKVLDGFDEVGTNLSRREGFDKVFLKAVEGKEYDGTDGYVRYDALFRNGLMTFGVQEGKIPRLFIDPLSDDMTSMRVLGAYYTVNPADFPGPFTGKGLYLRIRGGLWTPLEDD